MKKVFALCLALSLGTGFLMAQETEQQEKPKTEKECCKKDKEGKNKKCCTAKKTKKSCHTTEATEKAEK